MGVVQLAGLLEEGLRGLCEGELFVDASSTEEGGDDGVELFLDFTEARGVVRVSLAWLVFDGKMPKSRLWSFVGLCASQAWSWPDQRQSSDRHVTS